MKTHRCGDFLTKAHTYQHYFHVVRPNSHKENQRPWRMIEGGSPLQLCLLTRPSELQASRAFGIEPINRLRIPTRIMDPTEYIHVWGYDYFESCRKETKLFTSSGV